MNIQRDVKELIDQYDVLVGRALEVVGQYGTGFHCYVGEAQHAKLSIDGDDAVLSYPELEAGYYDSGDTIEDRSVAFPARLLFLDKEEFEAWKTEQYGAYQRQRYDQLANDEQKREQEERSYLAALKAKYER